MSADNRKIDEIARAEKLAYYKEWRLQNKDRVRQHNENYWKRRAKKKLAEENGNESGK